MFNLFRKSRHGIISNFFHASHARRVLVSAVDRPFRKEINFRHNNQTEAMEMATVFHELGYRVDVVDAGSSVAIDYACYDAVFGYGLPLDNLYRSSPARLPTTILFKGGAYGPLSHAAGLRRLMSVYRRRGVWLSESGRLGDLGLGVEGIVDGIVVLGNEVSAGPYRAVTDRPVHALPLFFYRMVDAGEVLRARDLARARRHFIWFAGTGLVHKGLDLVLEAFARHPGLHLHVYGAIGNEPAFVEAFRHELHDLPNVHVEGFLALQSPAFRDALRQSAFMICPSCSEASCSSVLNICGNGGIIPVLTRPCAIDLGDFGILVGDTTVEAVEAALVEAESLGDAELDRRLRGSAAFFGEEHSLERFHQRMKDAVQAILDRAAQGRC